MFICPIPILPILLFILHCQTFRKKTESNATRASAEANSEIEAMKQKAREELDKARDNSGQESQGMAEEIKMKERAKMQIEVKNVQEELNKVCLSSQS